MPLNEFSQKKKKKQCQHKFQIRKIMMPANCPELNSANHYGWKKSWSGCCLGQVGIPVHFQCVPPPPLHLRAPVSFSFPLALPANSPFLAPPCSISISISVSTSSNVLFFSPPHVK